MSQTRTSAAAVLFVTAGLLSLLTATWVLWDDWLRQCVLTALPSSGCWGVGFVLPLILPYAAAWALLGLLLCLIGTRFWLGHLAGGPLGCLAGAAGLAIATAPIGVLLMGVTAGLLMGTTVVLSVFAILTVWPALEPLAGRQSDDAGMGRRT